MIPKIIHYCWYGGSPIPEEYQRYINGWKKTLPDYKFILWDESNSPMELKYLKKAHENKKWANVANYMRLYAVHKYGGIYLDVDVEIVKPFDPLLNDVCFFGFQLKNSFNINNAIFGATKEHPFIGKLKDALTSLYDGIETEFLSSPHLTTYFLSEIKNLNSESSFDNGDIKIYPFDYFYPYSWTETYDINCITDNTYSIHHWSSLWAPKEEKPKENNRSMKRIKTKIKSWF